MTPADLTRQETREARERIGLALDRLFAQDSWEQPVVQSARIALDRLAAEVDTLTEFVTAHTLVEKGVNDFDLQGEAVERLRRASEDPVVREIITAALASGVPSVGQRITHGRHCTCSSCAQEDWTNPEFVCGMHGRECPSFYAPLGKPGTYTPVPPSGEDT